MARRHHASLLDDQYLKPYLPVIRRRRQRTIAVSEMLTEGVTSLADFAQGYRHFGLHRAEDGWRFAEWAPNATAIHLVGDFNGWQRDDAYALAPTGNGGEWESTLPADAVRHGQRYKLLVEWDGGAGERIPAYARRVVQDPHTQLFAAEVWQPPTPYEWRCPDAQPAPAAPTIYECHVGMAQQEEGVGSFEEFRRLTLPRIVAAGYNTIQLMAIMEHPYYGSFGYHVSNFFAVSSRFGTPDELKLLVDDAHEAGLAVIIDLVHSHAVKNENEGLSRFDGTPHQYFHDGPRGYHTAWDSRCFDYRKPEVLHFLLSNCRFWLEEYNLDGFRFDGITSMLYHHHGLGPAFDSYEAYFGDYVDEDAYVYLSLANELIHDVRPGAITVAEDVSGMPGLATPQSGGGCGFDFRLAMGVTDYWYHLMQDVSDDDWDVRGIWHELTNRRADEKTISYVECHDQAIVGGKTVIFQLADAAMYDHMSADDCNLDVDRALALHKMLRLATLTTAGHGYLNFMGNEFGHPEWVDFPREGNNWSYHYARRRWDLRDNTALKYHFLADFDRAMLAAVAAGRALADFAPRSLYADHERQVLCYERGGFVFLFNFHPTESYPDYPLEVPDGHLRLVLNTDRPEFGGHGRVAPGQEQDTAAIDRHGYPCHGIRTYLPARTAQVWRQQAGSTV